MAPKAKKGDKEPKGKEPKGKEPKGKDKGKGKEPKGKDKGKGKEPKGKDKGKGKEPKGKDKGKGKEPKGKDKGKKKDKGKAKEAKKKEPRIKPPEPRFIKFARESPVTQSAALVMCVTMLTVALWTTTKFAQQQVSTTPLRSGMKEMGKFFEHEGKTNLQIFDDAEELVHELQNLTELNEELQNDISDALAKIKSGWKQRFNLLIYFSTQNETWGDCRQHCLTMNSSMISIYTPDLETYLVKELNGTSVGHWIGLRTTGAGWFFGIGERIPTQYWKDDPTVHQDLNAECAALGLPCDHNVKCWEKRNCNKRYRCICSEGPKEKWSKWP